MKKNWLKYLRLTPASPTCTPMPFIVGSPRSGTTLLRLMLDSHPDLAIPPETGFLAIANNMMLDEQNPTGQFVQKLVNFPPDVPGWADFQLSANDFLSRIRMLDPFSIPDGFRLFYQMYAERFGKKRWGDKTPLYLLNMTLIEEFLPEAHFIHIIRDGRDCAISLRGRFFSPGDSIAAQAKYWRDNVMTGRSQGSMCKHYVEVHYENLLHNPGDTLSEICEFIKLAFHPQMFDYYKYAPRRVAEHRDRIRADGSILITHEERRLQQVLTFSPPDFTRIGMWQNQLSQDDVRHFEAIAGDALTQFGYLSIGYSKPKR